MTVFPGLAEGTSRRGRKARDPTPRTHERTVTAHPGAVTWTAWDNQRPADRCHLAGPNPNHSPGPAPMPPWQPRARWPQVTRAPGTLAAGAGPPLGQPSARAAALGAAKSALPPVSCRPAPGRGCQVHVQPFPRSPAADLPLSLPTGGEACNLSSPARGNWRCLVRSPAQPSLPGSAQKDSSDTSPRPEPGPGPGQPSHGAVSAACRAQRLSAHQPPRRVLLHARPGGHTASLRS